VQRGAISWGQLRASGLSASAIDRQVQGGRLHQKWPGVYAVGHPTLTREGWWWAALLASGPGSVLVGRAAAAAWRLLPGLSTLDVATRADAGRKLRGIRARRVALNDSEVTTYLGLPVTTIARTALDVAAWDRPARVPELLDHALLKGWYDHHEMLSLMARHKGHRGLVVLRANVEQLSDNAPRFRSRAERRARDHVRGAGLTIPLVNAWFPTIAGHGYELDLWWPELRLNVEIDGPHHAMPFQRAKDRRRDADLHARGVAVVRHPTALVDEHPERFVRAIARRLRTPG
jgi:very-short-patch-repair endonuclease